MSLGMATPTPTLLCVTGEGGHPLCSLSLGLREAAAATLAWSQGSFVLQEKLCLPAVSFGATDIVQDCVF